MNDCIYCRYLVKKGGIFYCPKTDEVLTILSECNNLKGDKGLCQEKNWVDL